MGPTTKPCGIPDMIVTLLISITDIDITYLSSVSLSIRTTVATLAFSAKVIHKVVRMVIQLLKVFEIGFERKSDVKMISSIGILSVICV